MNFNIIYSGQYLIQIVYNKKLKSVNMIIKCQLKIILQIAK